MRIAVVQPRTFASEPESNVAHAVAHVEQAAQLGARIVCLPETYPGPWTPPLDYDPLPALGDAARRLGVHVIVGLVEPVAGEDACYDSLVLLDTNGDEAGRYRRTVPEGPWIYTGGSFWDFQYQAGDALPVFEVEGATIGLLVCSEVYVPELSRLLALQGAEIIFLPAGLWKGRQWAPWRAMMQARATENLAYTATCQNILGTEGAGAGLAMICSPEEVLAESSSVGIVVADCDLERLRALRTSVDPGGFGRDKGCKAGMLTQWRRPELFDRVESQLGALPVP